MVFYKGKYIDEKDKPKDEPKSKGVIKRRHLRKLITYKPLTGEFIGCRINRVSRGYLRTVVDRKPYMLQRLAWIYVYGKIPPNTTIGFKNKDVRDLRIDNLYIRGSGSFGEHANRKETIVFKEGRYIDT